MPVAIITGASEGFGRALAEDLAEEGWRLVIDGRDADRLTLAAEHPDLHVYSFDPGDMRTRMHQDAFPGEDISDRSPAADSVPGLLALILGEYPSGRYQARCVAEVTS